MKLKSYHPHLRHPINRKARTTLLNSQLFNPESVLSMNMALYKAWNMVHTALDPILLYLVSIKNIAKIYPGTNTSMAPQDLISWKFKLLL